MSGKQRHSLLVGIPALLLALVLLVTGFPAAAPSPASAQELIGRAWSLRDLFAPRRERRLEPQADIPARPKARTKTRKAAPPSKPRAPVVEEEPQVEKLADARIVLVVGDFLSSGLAEGLQGVYAENPRIRIVDRSNGSSGFVRDDFYDWPKEIGPLIEAEKPAAIVVMLGSNDRQQMRVGDSREAPRSDAWTAEYERRATALVKTIRDKGLPLVWVGNLPFRSPAMSSDMIAFNDIYRRIVTDAGGEFIDVWDGFVDDNGGFVANGPDMNGQPAQLRAEDGINVTRAGRRKIAFYAEKPLARLLGLDGIDGPGPVGPDLGIFPDAEGEEPAEIDRTPPLAIDDLGAEVAAGLLGATVRPPNGETATPAERLAREGIAPEGRPGRADDFVARRPSPAAPAAASAPAASETTGALTR